MHKKSNLTNGLEDESNDKDDTFIKDVESLQAERLSTMRSIFQKIFREIQNQGHNHLLPSDHIMCDTYKFSVCRIKKCGSRSWLRACLAMDGFCSVEEILSQTRNKDVPKTAEKEYYQNLRNNGKKITELWSNSFKIVMVQNPFSRLVSAYWDKMRPKERHNLHRQRLLSIKINKEYRHLRCKKEDEMRVDDGFATFEDFANYILDNGIGKTEEPHWQPFYSTCKQCNFNYDFIVKLETLRQDIAYLKKRLKYQIVMQRRYFQLVRAWLNPTEQKKRFDKFPKVKLSNYMKYTKLILSCLGIHDLLG